ncbi:MAG: hypothetical protein QOH64_1445 [Acidimicrobiaceae bacterium]
MSLPDVVSREAWLAARKDLLDEEKELTRRRDALCARRRRLPMVEIEKAYVFTGPDGEASLLDLFDGRRQLVIQHFMWLWDEDTGCPSCTAASDEISAGLLEHLHARDTSLVVVSRGPIDKVERYKASRGWTFPFFSSYGSDFNYDFNVTIDSSVTPVMWNFRTMPELEEAGMGWLGEGSWEQPGYSMFLRDGDEIFHSYSVYARGTEMLGGSYYFLDLTALGRQEDWEEPKGRAADARAGVPDFST